MESLYSGEGVIVPSPLVIPKITDERLLELYSSIKPIVEIEGVKYFLREFTSRKLRGQSYIWNSADDKRETVELQQLKIIKDFLCLHAWGYCGLFKPSIAEVLSQIPQDVIGIANAFEIIEKPENREDVFRYKEVIDGGFHLSKVRTYKVNSK